MSVCFPSRSLLSGLFPFGQRQFFFSGSQGGASLLKAFPAQEFIFGLSKRKGKLPRGVGHRACGTGSEEYPDLADWERDMVHTYPLSQVHLGMLVVTKLSVPSGHIFLPSKQSSFSGLTPPSLVLWACCCQLPDPV